jgi:CheY-like chemotaxis protein
LNPKSILHVEDDDGSALLVQVALRQVGADITYLRVPDVDQALRFLAASEAHDTAQMPDLILLDLNLPGSSGFDILSTVRATPSWHYTPVVIFTSSSASRDMEKAKALEATKYILKPSTFEGYLAAIETLLQVLATNVPPPTD